MVHMDIHDIYIYISLSLSIYIYISDSLHFSCLFLVFGGFLVVEGGVKLERGWYAATFMLLLLRSARSLRRPRICPLEVPCGLAAVSDWQAKLRNGVLVIISQYNFISFQFGCIFVAFPWSLRHLSLMPLLLTGCCPTWRSARRINTKLHIYYRLLSRHFFQSMQFVSLTIECMSCKICP